MDQAAFEAALKDELDKRIGEVSDYRDDAFGHIGAGEMAVVFVACVLLPVVLVLVLR
ncbi:MAG: hypothetical protein IT383_22915 [Deltaproteobacteria bacterium]|nr:hypothetical protein [Deltaproteobacteria bacterium]